MIMLRLAKAEQLHKKCDLQRMLAMWAQTRNFENYILSYQMSLLRAKTSAPCQGMPRRGMRRKSAVQLAGNKRASSEVFLRLCEDLYFIQIVSWPQQDVTLIVIVKNTPVSQTCAFLTASAPFAFSNRICTTSEFAISPTGQCLINS